MGGGRGCWCMMERNDHGDGEEKGEMWTWIRSGRFGGGSSDSQPCYQVVSHTSLLDNFFLGMAVPVLPGTTVGDGVTRQLLTGSRRHFGRSAWVSYLGGVIGCTAAAGPCWVIRQTSLEDGGGRLRLVLADDWWD